jgi:hypothetical protein
VETQSDQKVHVADTRWKVLCSCWKRKKGKRYHSETVFTVVVSYPDGVGSMAFSLLEMIRDSRRKLGWNIGIGNTGMWTLAEAQDKTYEISGLNPG